MIIIQYMIFIYCDFVGPELDQWPSKFKEFLEMHQQSRGRSIHQQIQVYQVEYMWITKEK
jgi:hypothetical protein